MATSALPTFIDAIVSAFREASSLSGIRVFDGIEIDESYPGDAIVVGHDGNDSDEVVASSARQSYENLGAKTKMEDGQVTCVLWSTNGLTSLSERRVRAYQILGYVETIIRTDPSFGGVVLYSGLETHQNAYRQTNAGAAVVVSFTITYRAKI